jgi:SAM-dependent methyltransferase
MQNTEIWKESKFVLRKGKLVASSDPTEVNVSSRLAVTLVARFYQKAMDKRKNGRLLDLGCGKVPLYILYRGHATEITCVDWANTLHGNQHIDEAVDLSRPLPFDDNRFDTIILSDVLEHIPVPERLWNEMARVLAPNGRIMMNVPFYYWLHEQPHDYYRYTQFALLRFLEISGMEAVELTPIGGAPEIIADILAKCAQRIPKLGSVLARAIQNLALSFVGTNWGKRISRATAPHFPLGYFMIAAKPVQPVVPTRETPGSLGEL